MNQSQAEQEFYQAYDACKAKDMGDASKKDATDAVGRSSPANGCGRLTSVKRIGVSPQYAAAKFIPAKEFLPRVDLWA